jgi:formylglycine-generating enzyme required for sulfatase activity
MPGLAMAVDFDPSKLQDDGVEVTERTFAVTPAGADRAIEVDMVLVPAGTLPNGEKTPAFWMSKHEITNAQFSAFDPSHKSRFFNKGGKDQSDRGIPMNDRRQPVVRVTWEQAGAFCRAISGQDQVFSLPTEQQWVYACVAGSGRDPYYGDAAFEEHINSADLRLANNRGRHGPPWRLGNRDGNDGEVATARVGSYKPNAWGLHDMLGNVSEWTRTEDARGLKVVKGGSFYDRPRRCNAAFRLAFRPWQPVFNVGFRVVRPAGDEDEVAAAK